MRSLAAVLLLASACSSERDLYRWGAYEDAVRESLHDPGSEKAPERIRILSADVEQARREGRRVPPGVHAQLGYLHFVTGNRESAVIELSTEKELYPESSAFVDGLIARMKEKGSP